ncbi:cytochrome c oxidase subunit I [Sulfobacillus sp. hq2]|uniref:Cytochrome ubiquinol oxidase subunit I n=1 Tax=Sulfobacillus thermotolerans TaxID=338644 RepID=A0ABM6RTW5_9FIRM|nr:cytochrome c oxidase subunit I [Sulfobacillus sp. hq2]AUW94914.1 cytochrome ubiquinol oxidase subunit I [Sulfobacillus thermotolerans]MCY0908812.1 cytochrome c oxidase subunit I [Sulfobacillus thermotolerans]POB09900.1 cytochrome ubiquinol oxidase subunit I [Sulfobacillus sp. hq2]
MSSLLAQLFPPSTTRNMELSADVLIILTSAAIIYYLTRWHRWKYLWREWLTTVDHKKIGIMYLIAAVTMLFRGGVDALLLRAQLAVPNNHFLGPLHYDEIFTTHGTIMIFFMAMPLIFAMFNIAIPLMIGARDVAFPRLNAISFWLFAFAGFLFNISFVIGGSPNAGWTSYPPLTELAFNPGVGQNYYLMALIVTGIGTTATGINFLVTILRMRAPGMTLMRMPMFAWTTLVTSVLILFAFPPLTVAMVLTLFDRLFGTAFFTIGRGGMPMMYVNLFWLFGHPEVYILVLPSFGIFSEVVATFSRKKLFGYSTMVYSVLAITFLSYGTWVHHFFTMGAGAAVNVFFGLSTILIAIPTGIKIFNWIFTMWNGRIKMTVAMMWALAFIPTFVVGGATGVMLGAVPADYQFHNSYFLIAHFHNVIIGGTVFGLLSGVYYWWPKMTGRLLNERQGKWAFWLFFLGFWVTFMPQYALGFMGMTRRMYTYSHGFGWSSLNLMSTIGAFVMGAGFVVMVYNFVWSQIHGEIDVTGDPWDGRTLEWSTPSPAPEYNFARIPVVTDRDAWWAIKQDHKSNVIQIKPQEIQDIELPKSSAIPFLMGLSFFVFSVGMVFSWWWIAVVGFLGFVVCMLVGTFDYDDHKEVPRQVIQNTESALGRLQG